MITFRQFLESQENRQLYLSLIPKDILVKREALSKAVYDAYERGDHRTAERLDAQLEELEEKIEAMLADMDDSDGEDIKTGNTGGEEEHLDRDWSVQEDMARIYARYISGDLDIPNEDTAEVDPEEAKRMGWEYRQMMDHSGKPINRFYRYVPTTEKAYLAKMLRGAIWDSPYLGQYDPKINLIKGMTDDQIIDAAKDAYGWMINLRNRIKR